MTKRESEKNEKTIALMGNPNSGKTTLFNALCGARQHVGNYPGVTVERIEGYCHCRKTNQRVKVVDLPGTYSLTAYSEEERVARAFLLGGYEGEKEHPDAVVDVLDVSNLERHLYLATQLMELNLPLILVFNMADVARSRGIEFDTALLSRLLGVPVVETVGHHGEGIEELKRTIAEVLEGERKSRPAVLYYGDDIEHEIARLEELILKEEEPKSRIPARWQALKLLEEDPEILDENHSSPVLRAEAAKSVGHIKMILGESPGVLIADRRYGFISGVCREAVQATAESRHILSDQIDAVLTHPVVGLPLFLFLMYLAFELTFTAAEPFIGCLETLLGWVMMTVASLWPAGSESLLKSLLVDGILGGVGTVVVFLPNIFFLFLAIAVLEDSGYMARAAFLMDHYMHKIGLHGKSFIPLLLGFGCTVPAIMATRMLENRRDRMTTMMIAPLMSCGARLPIYALIIPAFFPQHLGGMVLWLIYLIGILLAILTARVLRSTLFRGETTPLVMELPPYRLPVLRGVLLHTWRHAWLYLRKAGTVILGAAVILWFLTSFPRPVGVEQKYQRLEEEARDQYVAEIGSIAEQIGIPAEERESFEQTLLGEEPFAEGWQSEPQGIKRSEAQEEDSQLLISLRPASDTVAAFLTTTREMSAVRGDFLEKMMELEPDSHRASLLEVEYRSRLSELKRENPPLYRAAYDYLTRVEMNYESLGESIERSHAAELMRNTFAGRIGRAMEPLVRPMGFDWRIGTALMGAFAAKEIFVAQLGIVYAIGGADDVAGTELLQQKLRENYTPLAGFCVMLFMLISIPCVATFAVTMQESGSWRWAVFQLAMLTGLAYLVTVTIYQAGRLLGVG